MSSIGSSPRSWLVVAGASLGLVAACGGITDPADYRAATAEFASAAERLSKLTDGDHASAELARANDGLGMERGFEKAMPAAEAMRRALDGLDVKAPELRAAHEAIVAAADEHVRALAAIRAELSSSVFSDSKKALAETVESFREAFDAWSEAVGE